MRPLFVNRDLREANFPKVELRRVPRAFGWLRGDPCIVGHLAIGPRNAIHWWTFPKNYRYMPFVSCDE